MPHKYEVTCDLFTLPYTKEARILYAPRLGFVFSANNDLINLLADLDGLNPDDLNPGQKGVLEFLVKKGVLNGSDEASVVKTFPDQFSPNIVTLFPTNQCNLRCRYCYASAGDLAPLSMDWHLAVSAIDRVIVNLKAQEQNFMSLGFHGGGEPLFPWSFIRRVVEYAEERCAAEGLKLAVHSATNGLLGEGQLEWLVEHFQSLNISFDGLPHVQDYHRPLPNGKGSFAFVDRTLRFLDERDFTYGLRGTVSSYNVDLMEESLDYIAENYKTRQAHFEPLFYCGRCKTSDDLNPGFDKFSKNFQACLRKCKDHGIALAYSGCRIESLTSSFCGVSSDNFSVTPDGFITACYEVTSRNDPKSDTFFIGKIGRDGALEIDEEKRRFLHSLTVDNLAYCADCFAKWHCAGECAVKIPHEDYRGARGHDRCRLNRELVTGRIVSLIEGNYYHPSMKNFGEDRNTKET